MPLDSDSDSDSDPKSQRQRRKKHKNKTEQRQKPNLWAIYSLGFGLANKNFLSQKEMLENDSRSGSKQVKSGGTLLHELHLSPSATATDSIQGGGASPHRPG